LETGSSHVSVGQGVGVGTGVGVGVGAGVGVAVGKGVGLGVGVTGLLPHAIAKTATEKRDAAARSFLFKRSLSLNTWPDKEKHVRVPRLVVAVNVFSEVAFRLRPGGRR
jgi:hypothetical protein